MTSETDTGRTTARVAQMATQNSVLGRGETNLIGLFGPQDRMSALLREPSGRIRRVETGDRLSIGRIVGIDADGLMLEKNGSSQRLTLPTG